MPLLSNNNSTETCRKGPLLWTNPDRDLINQNTVYTITNDYILYNSSVCCFTHIHTDRAVSSLFDTLGKIPIAPPRFFFLNKIKNLNNIIIVFNYFQTPVSCHIQLVFHSNDTNLWRLSSTNLNALYVNLR